MSDSTLSLLVDGQLREIPFTDIREVVRKGDSMSNGFHIGLGVGALSGVLMGVAGAAQEDGSGLFILPLGLMFGVMSAGVGALVDHFHKGRTVVYRMKATALRLDPSVSIRRDQVSVSIAVSGR